MKLKKSFKRWIAYIIPVILVTGVVAGAGIWLLNVDVPVEYDDPYTVSMSQSEIGPDYEWSELQFRHTTTTDTAYFNESGSGVSYHQYVRIQNPTGGANVNVIADIEEPYGFSDQMGFTILDGIVEPGEAGEAEVESWGNISTGDIGVAAGETETFTVIYTLSNDAPSSNDFSVRWDFSEGEAITVNSGESIQNAIDSATGTVIFVEPGTYNENLTIDVPGLVLTSTQGPEQTVIDTQGVHIGVEIKSNLGDITVEGFTVKNWSWGGIGQGISGREGTSVHVKNNILQVQEGGHDGHGNSIQVTGNGSSVIGNEVEVTGYNSEKDDSPSGILNWGSSHTTIRDNNIYYVDEGITDKYTGIGIGGGSYGFTPPAEDLVIKRNTIFNTTKGLEIGQNTRRMTVEDNTFNENRVQVLDVTEQMDLNEVISLNNFNPAATVVDNKIVDDPGTNTALNLDTNYSSSSIQDVINHQDTSENNTIIVGPGTYDENITIATKNQTFVSSEMHNAVINGKISISADDTIFRRFTVSPQVNFTSDTPAAAGIFIDSSRVTIEENIIEGIYGNASVDTSSSMSVHGIQVFGYGSEKVRDIIITNNLIRDIRNKGNSSEWPYYGGAVGIKIQNNIERVTIENNTIKNIHSAGWTYGIVSTPSSQDTTQPKNVMIKRNHITAINDGTVYDVFADETAAPYPGVSFGLDTASGGFDSGTPADASEVDLHYNNLLTPVGVQNKDEDQTLNAVDNWWGDDTGPYHETDNTDGQGSDAVGDVNFEPWLDSAVSDAGTNW